MLPIRVEYNLLSRCSVPRAKGGPPPYLPLIEFGSFEGWIRDPFAVKTASMQRSDLAETSGCNDLSDPALTVEHQVDIGGCAISVSFAFCHSSPST